MLCFGNQSISCHVESYTGLVSTGVRLLSIVLCFGLVTKVFVIHILAVDYNLKCLELEDPLD